MTHIHQGNMDEFRGRGVRVFIDGTELNSEDVYEANDVEGYVVLVVKGSDGWFMVTPGNQIRRTKQIGLVHINFDGQDLTREQMDEAIKQMRAA